MGDTAISSYKGFSECLAHSGIIVHDRGKSFSYEFLDAEKKHRRARGKTLGTDYEKETILDELELRQMPADPDISHLRKYSREAETSYLSSQQRSDRHGRDHQISTSPDTAIKQRERDAEQRKPATTRSSQGIDRLTIAIKSITDDLQRFTRQVNRFIDKRLGILNQLIAMNKKHEQSVKAQKLSALTKQTKQNKINRQYPSRRSRGRER